MGSSFRLRLARVSASGKVAAWDPQVEPSQVSALAVSGEGELFLATVGGIALD